MAKPIYTSKKIKTTILGDYSLMHYDTYVHEFELLKSKGASVIELLMVGSRFNSTLEYQKMVINKQNFGDY